MIVNWIINWLIDILWAILYFFPTVQTLPFGMDNIVINAVGLFKGFALIFPPMQIILNAVLIYIGIKLGIMLWSIVPIFGKVIHRK